MSHADYIAKCDESQLRRLVEMANTRIKEIEVSGWVRLWTVSVGNGNMGWFRESDYAAAVDLLCHAIRLEAQKRPGRMVMANIELENFRPEEVEELLAETPKPPAATLAEPTVLRDALEQARYALKEAGSLYSLGFNVHHATTCPNSIDSTGSAKADYERAADDVRTALEKALEMVRVALDTPLANMPAGDAKLLQHSLERARTLQTTGLEFAANLCRLGVTVVDGTRFLRHDSVMNEVKAWRNATSPAQKAAAPAQPEASADTATEKAPQ